MARISRRKKLTVVAALLIIVVITAIFAGCTSKAMEVNPLDVDAALGEQAYGYMVTLANEYGARTLGSQGELDAANYIASVMLDFGYSGAYSCQDGEGLQEFKTTVKRYNGEEVANAQAYNVVFSKKSTSANVKGEIILSCQYDNLYSEKADISGNLWNADGSYESGAAVATVLTLANALKDAELDYDLTFAFFTGGSYEWKGAKNFVDNLDRAALDKIALLLNFSMPAGGDNWYIYTGENTMTYGRYLYACSQGVTALPKDRNVGQFALTEDWIYSYANIGMLSNHYYFDLKGIPTANFLSLNWEINDNPLFSEMKGEDNVYHTRYDTLENMLERKGEEGIKAQLSQVINASLTALDTSNQTTLEASLGAAKSERVNAAAQSGKSATMANVILKVVLIAGIVVASYLLKIKINKNIGKLVDAKKAKEAQTDVEENQSPFANDSAAGDAEQVGEREKSDEKSSKEQNEDPFV